MLLEQNKNQKKIIELEKKINDKVNEAFKFAKSSKYPKLNSALSKNYSNTFSKVVKNFFDNQADFSTIQEKHLPKPY